ncbi:hypothetical protein [Paraburkholderia monticola]|nr:hypothetical protein [Paraburkholderia monticola]
MAYDADKKQLRADEQAARTHEGTGGWAAKSKAAVESVAHWAWSPASSHYDWMDLHSPFASID